MSSLTTPSAQSTVDKSAAIIVQPAILYQATNGDWIATTNPADAVGKTTGLFTQPSGDVLIDPTATSGLRAVLTPSSLLAY